MATRRSSRSTRQYAALQRMKRDMAQKRRGPEARARLDANDHVFIVQYGRLRHQPLKDPEESRQFSYIASTYAHLLPTGSYSINHLCKEIAATYDTIGDSIEAAKHRENIAFLRKICQ